MNDARRRAVLVANAIKWIAIAAGLAAPLATDDPQRIALFLVAVIGAALRVDDRHPSLTLAGTVGLVAGAAAAAGATGGPRSFAYAAVFVLAADTAAQRGGGAGATIGFAGTVATVAVMIVQPGPLQIEPVDLYVLLLTPLAGLAFGTIHRDLPITGVAALRATTQTLDELVSLAQRVQPGLDRWAVAEAAVTGLRDHASSAGGGRAAGPHLLIAIDGVVHGVGVPWNRRPLCLEADLPPPRGSRHFRSVAVDRLPVGVGEELIAPRWLVHRLDADTGGGAVLVDARTSPSVLDRLVDTISTASLALANARRFEDLRSVATDTARGRLAHDLHDGIAQALTHARFELELLSMRTEDSDELTRARNATDAALFEVRRTIGELREDLLLSESMRTHVENVRSFARVPVDLTIEGGHEPPREVGEEISRLAQEALSNALRHSGCSRVVIELCLRREALLLTVRDDGRGIAAGAEAGVGLTAMQERARAIGGDLHIGDRPGGGTVVQLQLDRSDHEFAGAPDVEPDGRGREGEGRAGLLERWRRRRGRR